MQQVCIYIEMNILGPGRLSFESGSLFQGLVQISFLYLFIYIIDFDYV